MLELSDAAARGWRAYRVDAEEFDDSEFHASPALAFYCPDCARREFTH
jgi:hypothetical protein